MWSMRLWIPLLGSIPLAAASAGVQDSGSSPPSSAARTEQRIPLGETAGAPAVERRDY